MKVDENIVSAIRMYFLYAVPPGSCTELLLRGNFDDAKLRAHMLVRDDNHWNDHVAFVKNCVPVYCKNENYDTWKGYRNLSNEEREQIKTLLVLSLGEPLVKRWLTYPYGKMKQ